MDNFTFQIFNMILTSFKIDSKSGWLQFLQKVFLMANISMEVILTMFFLIFNNANIYFAKREIIYRFYTTDKALLL